LITVREDRSYCRVGLGKLERTPGHVRENLL